MFKKFFCVRQQDKTDCAAACLATVAKQYKLNKSITKIRQQAGTDRDGTNILGIVKAAKSIGFNAKSVRVKSKNLENNIPYPAIAHINIDGQQKHFVVIHRVKKNKILVADPGSGLIEYKQDDFIKIWTKVLVLLTPNESFKPGNETTNFFSRFITLLFPHKKLIFEILVSSIIFIIFGILAAFFFKFLIDKILVNSLYNTLHYLAVGMIILMIFRVSLQSFRSILFLYLGQKIDITLVFEYLQHVVKLPMSFFDSRQVGEILARLSDENKIKNVISGSTIIALIDSLFIVFAGIFLFMQSWKLFCVCLFFIPPLFLLVGIFSPSFKKLFKKLMEEGAESNSFLFELFSGIFSIKSMNAESHSILEAEKRYIKLIKSGFRLAMLQISQGGIHQFLAFLSEIVILWIGAVLIMKGEITIGQLITFNALLAYFFQPIMNLIKLQPTLQEAFVASNRFGEILDMDVESKNEANLYNKKKIEGNITIKNLNFHYKIGKPTLKDINLTIKKGEKIALVGESGSGKTTFVKLLLKYYFSTEGEIIIDDYNIKDIQTESLRDRIGYVAQDIFLFSGTIRDNIAFGQNIDHNELIEAGKNANAHDFINEMEMRYDTKIGERGATLSGGQKQRIALARVIIKKPDMLILDEATSNLDSISEKAIHKTINRISKGITTIIIAHRLSTIVQCDRIIILDKGRIVEEGTHYELLNKKGKYFELWQMQYGYQEKN